MPLVSVDRPWYLLGLLLLPLAWWVGSRRWSRVEMDPLRRGIALLLRSLLLTCLVLALAGIHLLQSANADCTLFVIDASYSVPRRDRQQALDYVNQAVRNMRGEDRIGVLTVGGEAKLSFEPSPKGKVVCELTVTDGAQTNLARGVAAALSYFPENTARRIVLVSDGNETRGSLLEAARSAVSEDVPVDVIPVGTQPEAETLLDRMVTPAAARRSEPFPIRVMASSVSGGQGTLKLYRDGQYAGEQKVTLKPGKNAFTLTDKIEKPGFYTYEARLETPAGQDTLAENNRAISYVRVKGSPRLLLVRPDPRESDIVPEDFLPRALTAQNIRVDTIAPRELPGEATAVLPYDGIILSDVAAASFTENQIQMLQYAVRDLGLGLTMIGGTNSYGAGGWYQTPLEEALPVDMDVRKMRRFPGVALAVAIDYSGSMNVAGRNTSTSQSKLQLAQEAAHRAVDTLTAQDQVGLLAVDTRANVVVPLQYATDKPAIHAGIGAVYGGGGTEMSAAVKACYEMLQAADAKVKHAILVTDGQTGPFDYGPLIRSLREKKITFSLLIIDEGQSAEGVDPLRRVAERTGGRYYFVRDAGEIPKIFTREVQTVSKPPIVEEPFLPRVTASGSPLLQGISWETVPPLLGYNAVTPKPTAEIGLTSHKGDAVLAAWQYGLGKTVAFTADAKARWGAQWLNWAAYGPFWAQAIRWSLKKPDTGSYQSTVELVNGRGQITVEAMDENADAFINFLDTRARVIGPNGETQSVRLTQTAAGRYIGSFDAAQTGSYVTTVVQKGQDGKPRTAGSVGLAVAYSPEYAALKPNTALLAQTAEITGGRVLTNGETLFTDRRVRHLPVPLALPLIGLTLFLLPFDIANRRLALNTDRTAELLGTVREKAGVLLGPGSTAKREAVHTRVATTSVGQLRERRARWETAETVEEQTTTSPLPPTPPVPQRGVVWGDSERRPSGPPAPPTVGQKAGQAGASGDYRTRLQDAKRRATAAREDQTGGDG